MNQKWRGKHDVTLTDNSHNIHKFVTKYSSDTDLVENLIDSLMWLYLPYSRGMIRY